MSIPKINKRSLLGEIIGLQDGTLMAHADGSVTETPAEKQNRLNYEDCVREQKLNDRLRGSSI